MENVAFSFGPKKVLRAVNLSLGPGEISLLWGLNGSGKTTLGKVATGLFKPAAGRVTAGGSKGSPSVSMVLAEPSLMLLGDTPAEDALIGPANLGLARDMADDRAREALRNVGLWEIRERPTAELSSGEQKRLAVAGVLAMNPSVLILDEPFAFIDDAQVLRLFKVIERVAADGRAVLVLSGRLLWPERFNTIYVLHEGAVRGGSARETVETIKTITAAAAEAPAATGGK